MIQSGDAMVAVIDASGTVYALLQRACPDIAMRRVNRRLPSSVATPLVLFAVYGPDDWTRIARYAQATPTVVVTTSADDGDAARAWIAGAFGLLHTGLPLPALRRAIARALDGEPAYSRVALGQLIKSELVGAKGKQHRDLTPRQTEIIALIARGASDREIGDRLGIATSTTQKHVQGLLRRLDVPNRAAAVAAMLS